MIIGVAGFVSAGNTDRWAVFERTNVLADAATDALFGIDVRLLDGFFLAVAVPDFDLQAVDRLVGDWAMLFADHALAPVSVGDAAGDVEGGYPKFSGVLLVERQRNYGLRWADLAAEVAHIVAVADLWHKHGGPKTFQAGLGQGWLKAACRADLHAQSATSATL